MTSIKKGLLPLIITVVFSCFSYAQADGLLSGLFSSKEGLSFEELLSFVPAETAYLAANKKPMPEEVVEFQLQRAQQMIDIFSKASKDMNKLDEKSVSKTDETKKTATDISDKSGEFFEALFMDLGTKLKEKKFKETGLSTKANNVIYGLQTFPVLRLGIADKDAVFATLKRAEKTSGYKLELSKCGMIDCFVNQDEESDMTVTIAFLKKHIALSVFPSDKKELITKHLIGEASPEKSFSGKNWDRFLADNKFSGYGEGFINLQTLFKTVKPLMIESLKESVGKKFDKESAETCSKVMQEHVENMPEILFGTKDLQKTSMDYEVVLKTSPTVSNVLQTIANKTNINKRSENAIIDFGLNINFIKLRDALTLYTAFLENSAKKHKCNKVDPIQIRKTMGGMMMAMNMGLTQLKSLYLSVNEVEFDKKMQPKSIDAFVSIGTEDPAGLVGMLAVINPGFATLNLPADGKTIKVPEELIPSKGSPVPPISLSRGEKTLNIMIGNDKPALAPYETTKPEIISFGINGKRYYKIMEKVLDSIPTPTNKKAMKEQEQSLAIFKSMENMSGNVQEEIYADERGLVIDYHVQY